jgi:hypothetical protein
MTMTFVLTLSHPDGKTDIQFCCESKTIVGALTQARSYYGERPFEIVGGSVLLDEIFTERTLFQTVDL